jgi:hypothetical protein
VSPTVVTDAQPLTLHDYCDVCGARAYLRVTLATGELLFCGHHGRQHEKALAPVALAFRDERSRI